MTFRSKSQKLAAMLLLLSGHAVCIEVIGAALSRTGTYSTKLALNSLGFKTYHFFELLEHPEQVTFWYRVAMGEKTIDDALSFAAHQHNYTATLDAPMVKFYKRQMELFPDAKVVLTVRDSGKAWAESMWAMHEFILVAARPGSITWPSLTGWFGYGQYLGTVWEFIKTDGFLPDIFMKPDADKATFVQHHANIYDSFVAEVKAHVPENRLLVFNAKEGWDPLCRFLGVQAPDGPYPKSPMTRSRSFGLFGTVMKIYVYGWIPTSTVLAYLLRNRMKLLISIVVVSKAVFYAKFPIINVFMGYAQCTWIELFLVIVLSRFFAQHKKID